MDVQGRPGRDSEQVGWDQLTVRGQEQSVGREGPQQRPPIARAEALWRLDSDPLLPGPGSDRRRTRLEAPPGRSIGLADDEQVVAHRGQAREERNAECAGAEEREAAEGRH